MGENNRGMNHGIETFRRSITCGNFESHDFNDWAGKSKTTSGEWNSHPDIFESQKSTNPTKPPQKWECLVWNVNYKCTNLKKKSFLFFLKWHLSVWHAVCLKCGLQLHIRTQTAEHLRNAFKISINYNILVVTNLYQLFWICVLFDTKVTITVLTHICKLCLFTHLDVPVLQKHSASFEP